MSLRGQLGAIRWRFRISPITLGLQDRADCRLLRVVPGDDPITPLLASGRYDEAAEQLLAGVDTDQVDWTAVPDRALHYLRQHRQRLGSGWTDPSPPAVIDELRKRGATTIPDFVESDLLATMAADFDAWTQRLKNHPPETTAGEVFDLENHVNPRTGTLNGNNAGAESEAALALACRRDLVAMARSYLRGTPRLRRIQFLRYEPLSDPQEVQFAWHHDMEDRVMKVMILLTDVGRDDQAMELAAGTHNHFRPLHRFGVNRLPPPGRHEQVVRCEGPAGTAFLFDPNGTHRGARTATGRRRDVVIIEYDWAGVTGLGSQLPAGAVERVMAYPDTADSAEIADLISPFSTQRPAWNRTRSRAAWLETLRDTRAWLRSSA